MTINSSQLKTTWRGAYDNSTTYNTNDMVLYNGSAWIYRNATSAAGNAPGTASIILVSIARLLYAASKSIEVAFIIVLDSAPYRLTAYD